MKFIYLSLLVLVLLSCGESRKTSGRSRSSSSGRGSSRKTANPQPAPTSFSHTQAAAPKQSVGWQERPKQTKPSSSHSYPSSNTGLSGNNKPVNQQQNVQQSHSYPQNVNQQQSHSYPASSGLSGQSGSGAAGYPQQQGGLSGSAGVPRAGNNAPGYPNQQGSLSGNSQGHYQQSGNQGYQQQHGAGYPGGAPPPYPGNTAHGYGYSGANNNYHHQGPPPPYSNMGSGYGPGSSHPGYSPQSPGYFGNYANRGGGYGGVSRTGGVLKGVGIAGAGVGTILTGLALWNLARSTGQRHHTVIYDNRGAPIAVAADNNTTPEVDSILGDLVNCSLTISNENSTEVLGIPCSIATSFSPNAKTDESLTKTNEADRTECTITVVNKEGKEFMTTIPCALLLKSAAENNVTEPPPVMNEEIPVVNGTSVNPTTEQQAFPTSNNATELDCIPENGSTRDPINPCFAVTTNITVIPLTESSSLTTPIPA